MTQTIVELSGSGNWEVPEGVTTLDYVFLQAGGANGGGEAGGGGGAGESLLLENVDISTLSEIAFSVGNAGEDTEFGGQLARGGGVGGSDTQDGQDGGSGGGGGRRGPAVGGESTAIFPGLGNSGGNPIINLSFHGAGGGGGGAGEPGGDGVADGTVNVGGKGGDGIDLSSIFGTQYGDDGWFGAGGGGGTNEGGGRTGSPGQGGKGGGGNGANGSTSGAGAKPKTGGGGGGGGRTGTSATAGGPGGSGTILIAYTTGETSTGETTGTGTTSTGPAARLTPLNLFLVSIRLPDEPVEDPEPEPAEPGIVPVDIGEFWAEQGGWLGAYISLTQDGVPTHALILSDKAAEITSFWGNGGTYPSTIDGPGNFAAALSDGRTYATAVQSAFNDAEHGGFDDWYVGALDEMYALYYNLKPTTAQNNQSAASDHPYYVPFRTGTNTGLDPLRTSIPEFQDGGSQFFEHDLTAYWSSTASVSTTLACQITFNAGFSNCNSSRTQAFRLRPIRRAPVTWTVP